MKKKSLTNVLGKKENSSKKRIKKYKLNSFFAGIGGFDFGFQKAGAESVFHCEINPYCRSVLKKHWPTAQVATDIREVSANDIPDADIWAGGFPCQDVSVARGWLGRDGLKGENTGLFYPFISLIKKRKPNVVLLENVNGLLSAHDGKDFLTVVQGLTDLGYGVAWRVFNTRYFGAPQSRPRVYICAWFNDMPKAIAALYESEPSIMRGNPREGFLKAHSCETSGAIVPEVAYCLAATSGRHTGTDWSRSYVSYKSRVRRLTPVECEGLQGFPIDWSIPASDFKQSVEDIDTQRYHALGNAVSTPVVEWVAKRIVSILDEKIKVGGSQISLFDDDIASIQDTFGDFSTKEFRKHSIRKLERLIEEQKFTTKWKSGGCAFKNLIADIPASPAPVKPIPSLFINVIEKRVPEDHYFLSGNAATGILRRVDSQGRQLFAPLRQALEKMKKLAQKNKTYSDISSVNLSSNIEIEASNG